MPRHCRIRLSFLMAVLAIAALAPPGGPASAGPPAPLPAERIPRPVRLLTATEVGISFEIDVAWEQLGVEPAVEDNRYVRLSLPGLSATAQAGAPELPFVAELIGVPFGVSLRVRAEPGEAHTQVLAAPLLPVPTQRVEGGLPRLAGTLPALPAATFTREEDPAIYGADAAYPGTLAEVAGEGTIRQQRVAGIAAYPLQYNPATHTLTVYESLTIVVSFDGGPAAIDRRPVAESAAYEEVLKSALLNYEAARAWRQAVAPSASNSGAGGEGAPWSPPVPGWRIRVREDGLYRLTYAELQDAGLPVDEIDPRTFQLYHLGAEAAVEVSGEADGVFDAEDSIVFFGQAVGSKYTRDNVYWLTYGQAPGARMAVRDGTPGAAETPDHYAATRFQESSAYYITQMPGDEGLEHWIWDWSYAPYDPSWEYTVSLPGLYSGSYTARLTVSMLGFLDEPIDPDHHVRLYMNGVLIDDLWWDGIAWQVRETEFAQELLAAGNNTLAVVCPNDTGVGEDLVYIDWVRLEFANTFAAEAGELAFAYGAPGTWKYRVEGFSSEGVAAYDVSDPAAVVRIEGVETMPSGAGYAAEFEDDITEETAYWTAEGAAYRTVQAIEADTPSDLQSEDNGADQIVVTHHAFWEQAGALREFRVSQGLRAVRADVQDVYDEFGYGVTGIEAIRDFLAYAYAHWQAPAPTFVVLLGDGTYDPKDYLGYGRASYVPPYLAPVDPWMVETAADNRYVTIVGDDPLPDMMLGRLSASSIAEAAVLVGKAIAYEQSPAPGDWNQSVLAVADNADGAGDFAAMSDALLAGYLPAPYLAQKVHYGITHTTPAQARAAIQSGINAGVLIVNYIGHADYTQWAEEKLFATDYVGSLLNGARLPVMLPMTCLEGYYPFPYPADYGYESLAEVVTRADGRGAVASWSPSGFGASTGHHNLDQGFFEAVFLDGLRSLGEATTAGKLKLWASGSDLDLLDTYLLFGDPATRLHVLGADLGVAKAVEPEGAVLPGALLTYTLAFTNTGPSTAHQVVLTDIVPLQLRNPRVIYTSPEVIGPIPGTTYAWEIADLPPGGSGTIQLQATVRSSTPPGSTVVNTAEIAGAEPDAEPGNNVASVGTQVAPILRVGPINVTYQQPGPGRYAVTATTRILDIARVPVEGATVAVEWTWPGGGTTAQEGITNALGRVQFRIKTTTTGPYQFCVTSVSKPGWVYDPARNIETCDAVTIP